MKLNSFQVWSFRSINDSGPIDVSQITALLGRNESGKSNLLLALKSLNPIDGFVALNKVKDFPRHRRLEECTDDVKVLTTSWSLTADEKNELAEILPRAANVESVQVGRSYGVKRTVSFNRLEPLNFIAQEVRSKLKRIVAAVQAAADKSEDPHKTNLNAAAAKFESGTSQIKDPYTWATAAKAQVAPLRKAIAAADTDLTEKQDLLLGEIESLADELVGDQDAQAKARKWVVDKLPTFIYLDEYPDFNGHQNITEYLNRNSQGIPSVSDKNFCKLCQVAGLRPSELQGMISQGKQEERNQMANRASAVVTGEIKRLWKDRPLKIRFNLDGEHFDTLISDPNSTFDVEVNLDERSRGFKWFFSFYITFAADTKGGQAEDAILLLDEPGLYLHAKSQSDLLRHLEKDFPNQILFTTHSPFMVPTHNLDCVRTVSMSESVGTEVTNDPSGDARTLFPLQAALGYELAQSLFIGPNNLVVEGVTDFWIISAVSDWLREQGSVALSPELTLTPAGGAQKVSYMVALLTSEALNVLVLLDAEKDARNTKDELVRAKLIREENVVFVSEGISSPASVEADIEDLLEPFVYEALIHESYANELKGKRLEPNLKIPRIAKRFEAALNEIGIDFHKTRPTRLFLQKMAADPASIVNPATMQRFSTLFGVINDRLRRHAAKSATPFR
jgi:predicted ATPase